MSEQVENADDLEKWLCDMAKVIFRGARKHGVEFIERGLNEIDNPTIRSAVELRISRHFVALENHNKSMDTLIAEILWREADGGETKINWQSHAM